MSTLLRNGVSLLLAAIGTLAVSAAHADPVSFVPNRLLVRFRSDAGPNQVKGLLAAAGAQALGQVGRTGVFVVQLPAKSNYASVAGAFNNRPEVEFAEPDAIVAPDDVTPSDSLYPYQWHLPKIAASSAWSTCTGSSSVTIAILDTGCDPTHPDLSAKYVPGWNTYDNNSDTRDVYGHGTAVAGAAAASTNNSAGVAAPAWGCKIMPMRISDTNGYGYSSSIASALTWAADHGARVANISYSMTWSATITTAAQYFMSKGGVVTMSAGNSGTFDSTAENPYILTVSATVSSDAIATWSTTGNCVDVAAPGDNIYTTNRGGGYGIWYGTSFSAPIVAGIAGLVISTNPNLTAQQVQNCIRQSADDRGTAGYDTSYGWGRVNAANALALAQSVDSTPPTVGFIAPSGGNTVSGSTTVQVSAGDNVGVSSVLLYLDGTLVGSDSSAPYDFVWNTNGAANGAHTLSATAVDPSGNTASAQVSVTVQNGDVIAPSVMITSPSNGTVVRPSITVTTSASDNVGVARVELYVNGVLAATGSGASCSFSLNTKKWSTGNHILLSKAFDAAGNLGCSQTVTVKK